MSPPPVKSAFIFRVTRLPCALRQKGDALLRGEPVIGSVGLAFGAAMMLCVAFEAFFRPLSAEFFGSPELK